MSVPSSLRYKGVQFYTPLVIAQDLLLRPLYRTRPHILIACMPKSGSTFLANILAAHRGLRRRKLLPQYSDREQELCEIRLSLYNYGGYVAQIHLRNSEWTQELIRRYGLTPVVLVRDLLDCVASIRDHIRKEKNFGSIIPVSPHVLSLDDDALDDMIVQFAMPWYLSFYAGWRRDDKAFMLHYDDLTADPAAAMTEILARANMKTSPGLIAEAIEKGQGKYNRFNKGVSGRGATIRPETRRKLLDMAAFFPELHEDRLFQNLRAAA